MKKKLIKCLAFTVLIIVAVLLIPVAQNISKGATNTVNVKYDKFKTSKSLFCINHGYRFRSSENFTVTSINGETFDFPDGKKNVDTDVIKYIVTESNTSSRNKVNISSYLYQRAMWLLVNPNDSELKNDDNAKTIVNKAYAYNNALNNSKDGTMKDPEIVQEGNKLVIYYSKGTYDGVNYSNLKSKTVTGAKSPSNIDLDGKVNGHTHKLEYEPNGSTISYTIEYEKTRTASLELYNAGTEKITDRYYITNSGERLLLVVANEPKCMRCGGLDTLTQILTLNELRELYKRKNLDSSNCTNHWNAWHTFYCEACDDYIVIVNKENNMKGVAYTTSQEAFKRIYELTGYEDEYNKKIQNLIYSTGRIATGTKSDSITFIEPVEINFMKEDFSGNLLTGAKIQVTGQSNVSTINGRTKVTINEEDYYCLTESDTGGVFDELIVYPSEDTGKFNLYFNERKAPAGYHKLNKGTGIYLEISYNKTTRKVTGVKVTEGFEEYFGFTTSSQTITVKNRPGVQLKFRKKDFSGNFLVGADIRIRGNENVYSYSGIKKEDRVINEETVLCNLLKDGNNNGTFDVLTVYPENNTGEFEIGINELEAPTGYCKVDNGGTVILKVKYNTTTGEVTEISSKKCTEYFTFKTNTSPAEIIVKNKPALKLNFRKEDFSNNLLAGAKIQVTATKDNDLLSGRESVTINGENYACLKDTDNDGAFNTLTVYPYDTSGTVRLWLDERQAPTGYHRINSGKGIFLVVTYELTTGKVTSVTTEENVCTSNFEYEYNSDKSATITIKNAKKEVKLNFQKMNFDNEFLPGAKISVNKYPLENNDEIESITGRKKENENYYLDDSDNDGVFAPLTVYTKGDTGEFKISVREHVAPTDYNKINNGTGLYLTVKYNTNTGEITSITPSKCGDNFKFVYNTDKSATITIKDDPKTVEDPKDLDYKIVKKDTLGNTIKDAEFSLQFNDIDYVKIMVNGIEEEYTTNTITGLKTDNNGEIVITKIVAADNQTNVTMTITETNPATGYKKPDVSSLALEWNYDTSTADHKWVLANPAEQEHWEVNKNAATIKVENQPVFGDLEILKLDSLKNNPIQNVRFDITLEGVESLSNRSNMPNNEGKIELGPEETDSEGKINLKDLVLAPTASEIKVTIKETGIPAGYSKDNPNADYYYIEDGTPIEMTIKYNNGSWTVQGNAVNGTHISSNEPEISGRNARVTIKNQPYIKLGGMVWIDKSSTGDKTPEGANGIRENNEELKNGVSVLLISAETGRSVEGMSANTGKNGQPEGGYVFEDIPKTDEGYYVKFTYDGINYQATKKDQGSDDKHDSDVDEIDRGTLNENFKTITSANISDITSDNKYQNAYSEQNLADMPTEDMFVARSKNDTLILYKYNREDEKSSVRISPVGNLLYPDGWTDGNNKASSWQEEYSVRAKSGTYTDTTSNIDCGLYQKSLDLALGTVLKSAEQTINGATTVIKDFEDIVIDLTTNQPKTNTDESILKIDPTDYNYRKTDGINYKNEGQEGYIENNFNTNTVTQGSEIAGDPLKVYVTYSVKLMNQTPYYGAYIDEFHYYYDSRYTFDYDINKDAIENAGYIIESNNNNVLVFKRNSDAPLLKGDTITIDLKFEVDITGISENEDTYFGNAGEIITYTTVEGGLVDVDSVPGNANISGDNSKAVGKDEDDSIQSENGLNIKIAEDKTRKISGTVFEDTKTEEGTYNGRQDDGEKVVQGVKVQLIEIIKEASTGIYKEYIWQETTSNPDGYYEFTNFIPTGTREPNSSGKINCNYIVRFIYGDGAAYDLTANTAKYNGQDYKSTIDSNYKQKYYNNVMYNNADATTPYSENSSVARDNEARRLEVMAHSSIIDGKVGTALNVLINEVNYNSLTEEQKADIVEYYNSVLKPEFEKVKGAQEATNPSEYIAAKRIRNIFGITDTLPDITVENLTDDLYNKIRRYVSFKTWMCAETSEIFVSVDSVKNASGNVATEGTTTTTAASAMGKNLEFNNVNFGLALRPQTDIALEKHITALKITPNGTGVQTIVDASKAIGAYYDEESNNDSPTGITQGLATTMSTRDNRGVWLVATDVEELMQGAELEVEYTYVLRNDSEEDYLSKDLVEAYENQDVKPYNEFLQEKAASVKEDMKYGKYSYTFASQGENTIGTYLGHYYYDGVETGGDLKVVPTRVETFEEALNNSLEMKKYGNVENADFKEKEQNVDKTIINVAGNADTQKINTIIQNTTASDFLTPKQEENIDWTKKIMLRTTLSTVKAGELGAVLPSYLAEITQYSNASGRKDMNATPANLSYVHSDDNDITLENTWKYDLEGSTYIVQDENNIPQNATNKVKLNENDEFWGETIEIGKPTGEDKATPLQIVIITISAIATLGVGIVLIKKFVLKK